MNLLPLSLYEPELDIVGYDRTEDESVTIAVMGSDLTEDERKFYSHLIVKAVNSIGNLTFALVCAEADIEGIIESGLVEGDHPVHKTLKEIRRALA